MTTAVKGDNPDNALDTRGTNVDAGMQTNGITQDYVQRELAKMQAATDRKLNSALQRAQQAEQVAYEANQRLAEYQEVGKYEYDSEEERQEALKAMRSQAQLNQELETGRMAQRTLQAQSRSVRALSAAGVPWGYKHIDWADDAQTPEEVADRIIASIPYAREMLNREQSQARQTINQVRQAPQAAYSDDGIQDTGSPSGSTPGGILENWANLSREEREKYRKLAKRRNADGSSALRLEDLQWDCFSDQ